MEITLKEMEEMINAKNENRLLKAALDNVPKIERLPEVAIEDISAQELIDSC